VTKGRRIRVVFFFHVLHNAICYILQLRETYFLYRPVGDLNLYVLQKFWQIPTRIIDVKICKTNVTSSRNFSSNMHGFKYNFITSSIPCYHLSWSSLMVFMCFVKNCITVGYFSDIFIYRIPVVKAH